MADDGSGPIRTGVLGLGYMGKNHARILSSLAGVELVGVFDQDADKAGEIADRYGTRVFRKHGNLCNEVDVVIIALPTHLHFDYVGSALEMGLDVFVEKPITDDVDRAWKLCELSGDKGRILQVGHIERFNPVYMELPRLVKKPPIYISCERLSPFMPSWVGSKGVIIDLMIHDLDLVQSLVSEEAVTVNAVSAKVKSGTEDLAVAQVRFAGGTLANFVSSRVSQAKVRRLAVTQSDEHIAVDLLRQTIAIHHFISSDYYFDERMGFKQETVTEIPFLHRHGEPLALELDSFIESVRTRRDPVVSGVDGAKALELALRVMKACERTA